MLQDLSSTGVMMKNDQSSTKVYTEEDEQNITLEKLKSCPEKQPIDFAKQPVEILQQEELPKEWTIPRDLSVENIIGCKWFSETSWMNRSNHKEQGKACG